METPLRHNYLLVLGEREGLAWILRERRMAFPPQRTRLVDRVNPEDRLILYTTRGCFRNPTRDRGRVIGTAVIASPIKNLEDAVELSGRKYTRSCQLTINKIAKLGHGPELATLVGSLETFPENWPIHIRRTLVPLSDHDYNVLSRALNPTTVPLEDALPEYEQKVLRRRRK